LRFPAQAQAESHVGMKFPVILGKEPHIQHAGVGERASGDDEKLGGPIRRAVYSSAIRAGLKI
jgi:hypothetical protein